MGEFIIKKRVNANYQFNLKANNGEIILTSEEYTTKAGCRNGIESVKANASFDSRYDKRISLNNQYYFNLKAENGEIIGTSEMYATAFSRDKGIESVKTNAPQAGIIDQIGE